MPENFITAYMNYLRVWSEECKTAFSELFVYGSLIKHQHQYNPVSPSDFDFMAIFDPSAQHNPWARLRGLQLLRKMHKPAIERQQQILMKTFCSAEVLPPCKHSYTVLTDQETRFSIVKNTASTTFLRKSASHQYSLLLKRHRKVQQMVTDTLPHHLEKTAELLKSVQEKRKHYLLCEDADSRVQDAYEEVVKPLYRQFAIRNSDGERDYSDDLAVGQDEWRQLIESDWFQRVLEINSASQESTEAKQFCIGLPERLQTSAATLDLQLTVLDCALLWELLAELCYEKLEEFETRPQRCDKFLNDLCARSVREWNDYESGKSTSDQEPLRYQGCGLSVQVKRERPMALDGTDDSKTSAGVSKDPPFQSICDPHADDDPKLCELWHWRPNDSRMLKDQQQALCVRQDSPQTGLRLLVTEDAGTGKSIFLRRLQGWLCDQTARENLFSGQPPLVLRWQSDGSESMAWPTPEEHGHWRQNLRKQLVRDLQATQQRLLKKHNVEAIDIVKHVLKTPSRIVLLFDAFDQLTDPSVQLRRDLLKAFQTERSAAFANSLRDAVWRQMHVVVTSRKIAVRDEIQTNRLFSHRDWVVAQLDGWTDRQQVIYLAPTLKVTRNSIGLTEIQINTACRNDAAAATLLNQKKVFQNLSPEARNLLRVPQLLRLVRSLAEESNPQVFPTFVNRAELYSKATQHLLGRPQAKPLATDGVHTNRAPQIDTSFSNAEAHLSCVALEMMLRAAGEFVVVNNDFDAVLNQSQSRSAQNNIPTWEKFQNYLPQLASHTFFLITEQPADRLFAWKHREMMEYFCAVFLTRYGQGDWGQRIASPTTGQTILECTEQRLKDAVGNIQWKSTWNFVLELLELDKTASNGKSTTKPSAPVSIAASLSTLFEDPQGFQRPIELMWRSLELAKRRNWREFDHWKQKLNRQFVAILNGNDLDRARIAAALLPPDELPKMTLPAARRDQFVAEAAGVGGNWQCCPPDPNHDSTLSGEVKQWLVERQVKDQPGTFWFRQGSPGDVGFSDEHPRHWWPVRRFWMQATTVTVAQYQLFDPGRLVAEKENLDQKAKQEDCPMIRVNWYDAALFACWVGDKCRLPSESEWEFACRAGFDEENHRYSVQNAGSMTIDKTMANYGNPTDGETMPVRRYAPNRWGLWQMHGNVWEWCVDPKTSDYTHKVFGSFETLIENLENNPPHPHPIIAVPDHTYTVGPSRVLRGGSWVDRGDNLRCARRYGDSPDLRRHYIGFRLCWGE